MRTYRLIIPYSGNNGNTADSLKAGDRAARTVRDTLADTFGGFTEWGATGSWRNAEMKLVSEPVRVFEVTDFQDVSAATAVAGQATLEAIAREVKRILNQDAVYVSWREETAALY